MEYTVEMQDVIHDFSSKRVLNGISLKVKKGEVLGLLGPSGAGKTTIVKILTGQLRQTSGSAKLLGKDTSAHDAQVYARVGTMMDNFGLYEMLSVYDNLKFYADIYRVPKTNIDTLLEKAGLYEAKKSAVGSLSKGMRSRLSFVRAVMNNAEVLFLDEPTSGLDPVTTKQIHEMLAEQKEKGTTVFLTTHNMFEAESICDNVALLNGGELAEYGAPKEICKKYNRLQCLQIRLKDGQSLSLENGSQSAETVNDLLKRNMIETIHSTEPNLETVFIELTGRGLN